MLLELTKRLEVLHKTIIGALKLEASAHSVRDLSRPFGSAGVAAELIDHFAHHGCPTGLVTGSNA